MQRALERLEASEHGRWLYKVNMIMQDLWETVARGADDALSGLSVLINRISLDIQESMDCNLWRRYYFTHGIQHFFGKADWDTNSDPIVCR